MIQLGVARKYHPNLIPFLDTLKSNSINLYEMGFAFSIPNGLPEDVINYIKENNITLTGHLPFYINFGNKKHLKKSTEYLKQGLAIAEHLQGVSVFHLGFYMGRSFKEIKKDITSSIKEVFSDCKSKSGFLGIETTGKQKAIGTYDEVLDLIRELNGYRVIPILDIAHVYARSNGLFPSKKKHFKSIIDDLDKLSIPKLYFHAGGIEHSRGNEKKHISIKKCEPPLAYLIEELELRGKDAQIIIESPTSIEDINWLRSNKESFSDYTKTQIIKNKKQNHLQEFFR